MMPTICESCHKKDCIIEEYSSGEVVCVECGTVHDYIISDEYEGRTFEGDEDQIRRVGAPERPEQAAEPGTKLIVRQNGKTKVYKSYSKQTKIYKNFIRIQRVLSNAGITQMLIEKTKELYSMMAPEKNMQGRNLNHIIIALYYYASRIDGQAINFKEVAKRFSSVTERQIRKAFNSIKCYVADDDNEDELTKVEKNYIQLYIGGNQEKYNAKMLAYEIIDNINRNSLLEGKSPNTIAGLSLLLSYRLLNDNSDNSNEFFETFSNKATLSKAFEEIKWSLDKIIPQEYNEQLEMIANLKV